jgi:hypothetical protein
MMNRYFLQKNSSNGIKALPKQIGTTFFVTAAAALPSGLRQNPQPVELAQAKM